MTTNKTPTNNPYAPLETVIIQLLHEMIDLTVQCRKKMSEHDEKRVRRSLQLKVWHLWDEIRRFKAEDDFAKNLSRLRKSPPRSSKRAMGDGVVISKPAPDDVNDDPRCCLLEPERIPVSTGGAPV